MRGREEEEEKEEGVGGFEEECKAAKEEEEGEEGVSKQEVETVSWRRESSPHHVEGERVGRWEGEEEEEVVGRFPSPERSESRSSLRTNRDPEEEEEREGDGPGRLVLSWLEVVLPSRPWSCRCSSRSRRG